MVVTCFCELRSGTQEANGDPDHRREAGRPGCTFGGIRLGGSGRSSRFLLKVQLGLSAVFLQEEVRGSNELKKCRSSGRHSHGLQAACLSQCLLQPLKRRAYPPPR